MRKFLLLIVLLAACGKRGDPHPPVPVIPKATSDLVVAQRGSKLILSWSFPSLTTSGQKLTAIRRVVLYRYVEELPAQQPARDTKTLMPGDIDPTVPTPIALFAKIPPLGPMQFAKLREKVDSIEGANLAGATVGARLMYEDAPTFQTTDGRPVRITYGVVTEGQEARSDASNLVTIVPIDVPLQPSGVKADVRPQGVVLTWTAPDKGITGSDKPRIAGYDVYRYPATGELEELATPVNSAPISQTTYTDVPAYAAYNYRVVAIAMTGPPRLESDPSEAVSATYKDLLPPPAPTGLTTLVETKAVRLVWNPVEAADLAGYRVYRTEGSGQPPTFTKPHLLFTPQLITETNWRDMLVDPGISYFYEVTAVDKSGNESAPAKTDWVLVPKTP